MKKLASDPTISRLEVLDLRGTQISASRVKYVDAISTIYLCFIMSPFDWRIIYCVLWMCANQIKIVNLAG